MNRSFGYKKAFTLVEIVFVLVVYAIIAIFIPLSAKRMEKNKTTFSSHSSFECYWDADKEDDYKVKLYQKDNNKEAETAGYYKINGSKIQACYFIMPRNVSYAEMIAVGGGGAGGDFTYTGSFPSPENFYSYMWLGYSDVNILPDYMRNILNSADRNNLELGEDGSLLLGTFLKRQILFHSVSGNAGELVSYFFSKNKGGETLYIIPGRGGRVNCNTKNCGDGTDTVVYKQDETNSDNHIEILKAKGGAKGVNASTKDSSGNELNYYRFSTPLLGKEVKNIALKKSFAILPQISDYKTQAKSEKDWGASGYGAYTFPINTDGYFSIVKMITECIEYKSDGTCAYDGFDNTGAIDLTPYLSSLYFKDLEDNCGYYDTSNDFGLFGGSNGTCTKYSHSPNCAYPFYDKSRTTNQQFITSISRYKCFTLGDVFDDVSEIKNDKYEYCPEGSSLVKAGEYVGKCTPTAGKDGAFSIVW